MLSVAAVALIVLRRNGDFAFPRAERTPHRAARGAAWP